MQILILGAPVDTDPGAKSHLGGQESHLLDRVLQDLLPGVDDGSDAALIVKEDSVDVRRPGGVQSSWIEMAILECQDSCLIWLSVLFQLHDGEITPQWRSI